MSLPRYEVFTPTAGFILGENVLGDRLEPAVVEWLDLTDHATSITVTRGGEASTGLSSVDVGTVTVPLKDRGGLRGLADQRATRPNRPARVVVDVEHSGAWEWSTYSADLPRFPTSGTIPTTDRFYVRSSSTGNEWTTAGGVLTRTATTTHLWLRLRAGDGPIATIRIRARSTITSASVYVRKAGTLDAAALPAGWKINGATWSGTNIPLGGNVWREYTLTGPVEEDLDIRIMTSSSSHTTQWSRLAVEASGVGPRRLFTGKTADADTDYERDGTTDTSLTAQDAVSDLANTTRYGAIVDGGRETFRQRIERLQASTDVKFVLPADPRKLRGYSPTGPYRYTDAPTPALTVETLTTTPGDGLYYATRVNAGWSVTAGVYNGAVAREISGLQPGRRYRLEAIGRIWLDAAAWATRPNRYAIGVGGEWGPAITLDHYYGESRVMHAEFDAPTTAVTIYLACAEARSVAAGGLVDALWVGSVRLYEIDEPYRLRSIAYESSVASHLTLAADTVGAVWHPTRDNVIDFEGRSLSLRLVDVPSSPGDLPYTAIHMAYGTASVVNDLTLTNHGYDPESGNAADETYGYRDETSIATFGPRSANVDLALWTGDDASRLAMDDRSAEILAARSQRRRVPRSVTVRGDDAPARVADVELHDVITVVYDGTAYTATVIGIEHEVTPLRGWRATFTLDV